jgi:SAM-dependent methyltransferase
MPFPHHDSAWSSVAEFVAGAVQSDEHVVASDLFWVILPVVHRYRDTWLHPEQDPDWLVVHKGEFARIEPGILRRALRDRPVMFANDVFVVFGPDGAEGPSAGPETDVHVAALRQLMEEGPTPQPDDADPAVFPVEGVIERFDRFDVPTMGRAMDAFYEAGGYEYPTCRDRVYDAELDRLLSEMVGPSEGRRRLDLASGLGRVARVVGADGLVLTDISEVAVRRCRVEHPGAGGWLVMDACETSFRSGSFDAVVLCDAFEHVHDPRAAMHEARRLLGDGGIVFLTANNRNSLNQRITRALGHPEFVTNYQHITEIAYDDLVAMLDESGFDVRDSRGLFLYPYWGVPGVDEYVRDVIDEDPDIVEVSRELGELVGAAHAFVSVVSAEKRPV